MVIHKNEWKWGKTFTIVRDNGRAIVGLSISKDEPELGYINGLSVVGTIRKLGKGTRMFNDAIELAKKNGCKYAYLHCDKDSFVFDWYKRLGFKYYGDKPNENGFVPMFIELS